jgi:hypothetical protein
MHTTRLVLKKRPMTVKSSTSALDWATLHPEISKHLDVTEQRHKSAELNAQLVFSEPDVVKGRKKAQDYNRRNCVAITQRLPREWRQLGQELGFPRWVNCSAKEVARRVAPEIACARSLADDMVQDGVDENIAFRVGREFIEPFKLVLESGWVPGRGQHSELQRL